MPLRLALMAAIGALLALGACSSDTKTVTAAPTTPTTPTPDPDPAPDPAAVTLPAAAAMAFTAPRVSFSVGEAPATQTDTSVRTDRYGNRFRDVNGYRFTCEGADTCSWTITRDSDGMLSIATDGEVKPGVVPSVRALETSGNEGLFMPASGNWDSFTVPAGGSVDKNVVRLSCPAGGEACNVEIEVRGAARYLVASGAEVTFSRAQRFYDGLAYFPTTNEGRTGDPAALAQSLGDHIGAAAQVFTDERLAMSHHRPPTATLLETPPPAGVELELWGNAASYAAPTVTPTAVPSSTRAQNMLFAGFAEGTSPDDMAKTYGAVEADARRLGLVVSAIAPSTVPTRYTANAFGWTAELPVERANGAFPFAGADARSRADRWSMGFTETVPLGAGTESDMTDDGTLHIQVFTDYDTGAAETAETKMISAGTISDGLLLVTTGSAVPSTAPASQTIATGDGTNGTFNGVPGTFVCPTTPCTVDTSGATQTLTSAGGDVTFTPTPGAQMLVADSDWLAIGSWAVAMNDGSTSYGAFVDHGSAAFNNAAGLTSVQGDYIYTGPARGHYAEYDDGARESGVFAASARLVVDFLDASNDGFVNGTLRDFSTTAHGAAAAVDRDAWSINFAGPGSDRYGFDFDRSGDPRGPDRWDFAPILSGKWGAGTGDTLTGATAMKFYRPATGAAFTVPTAIAGTFAAAGSDDADKYRLSLIGAFGARPGASR